MQDKNIESYAKFKEALRVQIVLLGEHHPDLAITLSNLGIVSRACGRAEDSASYFRQAVEICNTVNSSIFFTIAMQHDDSFIQRAAYTNL